MPAEHRFAVKFGLTLAIWDYIFGTAFVPETGKDIRLGLPGVEIFPETFVGQVVHGFFKKDQL